MKFQPIFFGPAAVLAAALVANGMAWAADADTILGQTVPAWLSLHGQFTNVTQAYPSFTASFDGPNSLRGRGQTKETVDATLYLGVKLPGGLEFFVNPEIDQGFGLSNTLGAGGYPSGEAYKVGKSNPYFRLQRAFFRYTLDLGGETTTVESAANQFASTGHADNVTVTIGKFSATDIFDTNTYAHDPRGDFLNWSIVDSGAYDYAADAWGYTYGIAMEWNQAWWTWRAGVFDLSTIPNTTSLETGFQQFELVTEAEERHQLFGQPGKVKVLVFANRGRMANYVDALNLARQTGNTPDVSLVRRYQTRPGAAVNIEQGLNANLGAFIRLSTNDGRKEAFEFTEINRSIAAGIALKGTSWHRGGDTFGLAAVVNDISPQARSYFAAGGMGILIGDGQLPRYQAEKIIETYYKASVIEGIDLSLDFQHIADPAYDAVRGPVNIFGLRLHAAF